MKAIGEFLTKNPLYAALICMALIALPYFDMLGCLFASTIIVFVTLQTSVKQGAYTLLGVVVPCLVYLFWFHQMGQYDFMAIICILAWVSAIILRATYSWCVMLEVLLLLGLFIVVLLHAVFPDMSTQLSALVKQTYQTSPVFLSLSEQEQSTFLGRIDMIAPFIMGIIVITLLVLLMMTVYFGSWWQSYFLADRTSFQMQMISMQLKRYDVVLYLLVIAGAFMSWSVCLNAAIVMALPFVIVGLSFLHALARKKPSVKFTIIFCYIGLFFIGQIVGPVLGLIGLTDSWFNYRRRLLRG